MSASDSAEFETKYLRGILGASLLGLILLGLGLTFWGTVFTISAEWKTYLQSVGSSILASVIVYILISIFVEPKQRRAMTRDTSRFAIAVANDQFQKRFGASLPVESFAESDALNRRFRDALAGCLANSSRYDFKGSDGSFTTFRLVTLRARPELQRLSERRLCLVDPRDDRAVRGYAELNLTRRGEKVTETAVTEEIDSLKLHVYVSLAGLFEIREELPTKVYFHCDLPYFRCEMFDNGMFLTYYAGPLDYPETLRFDASATSFRVHQQALESSRRFSDGVLFFTNHDPSADSVASEPQFEARLLGLGCQQSIGELRTLFAARMTDYASSLGRANISTSELF